MPASVNLTDAAFRNVTVAPRPVIPTQSQRHEEDYDDAYLDRRADEIVSEDADLPLYTPILNGSTTCEAVGRGPKSVSI